MMYNHYIPGSNGIYKRHCVVTGDKESHMSEAECANEQKQKQKPACSKRYFSPLHGLDLGDLLLLCIAVLIMIDSDEEDMNTILIVIAAFLLLQ